MLDQLNPLVWRDLLQYKQAWQRANQYQTNPRHIDDLEQAISTAKLANSIAKKIGSKSLIDDSHERLNTSNKNISQHWSKLNHQVTIAYESGNLDAAVTLAEKSLNIAREIFSSVDINLATSLSNLARLYSEKENWTEAELLYNQALNICHILFNDKPNKCFATILNNLSQLYADKKKWDEAEHLAEKALKILRHLCGNHPSNDLGISLIRLAQIYAQLQKWELAKSLFDEAERVNKSLFDNKPNKYLAICLIGLAQSYKAQGQLAEAYSLFSRAKEINLQLHGNKSSKYLGASLIGLAQLSKLKREWEAAKVLFQKSANIYRNLYGNESKKYLIISLIGLAQSYAITANYQSALLIFIEIIQIENNILTNYFSCAAQEDRLDMLEQMHSSLEMFASFVWLYQSDNPRAVEHLLNAILQRKAASTRASNILNRLQYSDRYPELSETFDEWNECKRQLATTEDELTYKYMDARCRQLQKDLASKVSEIKFQSFDIKRETIEFYFSSSSQLIEFFCFHEYNFEKDKKGDSHYLALTIDANINNPLEFIDLGTAIAIDEVIEKYRSALQQIGSEQMGLTDKKKKVSFPTLSKVDREIEQGIELRKLVLDPILQKLPSDTDTLIIAADSQIYRIPFATLPWGVNSRVIDRYRIETLSAGGDVRRRHQKIDRPSGTPIIIGNPDYNLNLPQIVPILSERKPLLTMGGDFARMEDTETLVRKMCDRLKIEPCLDRQATSNVFQFQTSPQIIIAATHGFAFPENYHRQQQDAWKELKECDREDDEKVIAKYGKAIDRDFRDRIQQKIDNDSDSYDISWLKTLLSKVDRHLITSALNNFSTRELSKEPDPMLRCGIALAGANHWLYKQPLPTDMGKGVLLAHDIAQLNLWGTDLVVLIACSTGLGDAKNGQGMFGLRRAFSISGAKHAIVSLWDVPINASILLMDYFFQLYLDRVPPAQALHQAQIYVRNISLAELESTALGQKVVEGLLSIGKIRRSDDRSIRPLSSPYYWGAWICQG